DLCRARDGDQGAGGAGRAGGPGPPRGAQGQAVARNAPAAGKAPRWREPAAGLGGTPPPASSTGTGAWRHDGHPRHTPSVGVRRAGRPPHGGCEGGAAPAGTARLERVRVPGSQILNQTSFDCPGYFPAFLSIARVKAAVSPRVPVRSPPPTLGRWGERLGG